MVIVLDTSLTLKVLNCFFDRQFSSLIGVWISAEPLEAEKGELSSIVIFVISDKGDLFLAVLFALDESFGFSGWFLFLPVFCLLEEFTTEEDPECGVKVY